MPRRAYPSDVTDEEWLFVSPYLTLMREDAPQREDALREVFNGLCWVVRRGPVAYDAQRPAALAHGVSAVTALAQGQGVRGNGPRPAGTAASGWGKERAAFGGGS